MKQLLATLPKAQSSRQALFRQRKREQGWKSFEVELSPEDQIKLDALSKRWGVSRSEAFRKAISNEIENKSA